MLHRWTGAARRVTTTLLVACAALVAVPGIAAAQAPGPVVGLEIRSADPAARTVSAVLHCVSPEKAGRTVSLNVDPAVDIAALAPGTMTGAKVDTASRTIRELGPMPCDAKPQSEPQPGKPGQPQRPGEPDAPGETGGPEDVPGGEDGDDFDRGFLSRVWKFVAEVDGYEDGELSVTIGKVLNLPKRYRDQDDDLIDEDATVLVSKARVYDRDGERTSRSALDDAEDVKIHGKLLPEEKWEEDEDGEPVPTIRAKKVYITG